MDLTFHTVQTDRRIYAPSARLLNKSIAFFRSQIQVLSRTKTYTGLHVIVDSNLQCVGEECFQLVRLLSRYLLIENPARVGNVKQLKDLLMSNLRIIGFREHTSFFEWLFNCKIGNVGVMLTLYRTYASASDVAARNLINALKNPSHGVLGEFIPCECQSIDIDDKKRNMFNIARDNFFSALGFTYLDYNEDELYKKAPEYLQFGIFNDFFKKIKDLRTNNSDRLIYLCACLYTNLPCY